MAYVDYGFYSNIYGVELSEAAFNRLVWPASKLMDNATTGVDGCRKLKYAFPTDEEDIEAVKRCACELINTMNIIQQAEEASISAHSYITREDGTVTSKLISSVSSGSESVNYAVSAAQDTDLLSAVSDKAKRDTLYRSIVTEYLSGVCDANGVKLLYMGRYPRVR